MSELSDVELWRIAKESSRNLSKLLKAIGHSKRVEILGSLAQTDREYSWLLRQLRISKTALANHLNILVENNLIERLERGTYHISADGINILKAITVSYANSLSIREST